MKVCLQCGYQFSDSGWHCANCGYEPDQSLGFPQFAPEFAQDAEGYDSSYFEQLIKFEAGNFWFEARNALIGWAFQKYFPAAREFLEVGCGTGFVLLGLRKAMPTLVLSGSEIFVEGLKFVRGRIPDATLMQMDITRIPFADEFDVIGAFDVLEHVPDDEEALRQMYLAVKAGGGILVTVPQHPTLWSAFDVYAHHQRRYTRQELAHKVEQAGFQITFVTSFMFLLLPAMLASRVRSKEVSDDYNVFAEFELHPALNRVFSWVMMAEGFLIRLGISLPGGGSLLMVATKKI